MHQRNPWLVDYAVYCERYPDVPDAVRHQKWRNSRHKANQRARKDGVPDPYPDPQQVAVAAMVAQADRNLAAPFVTVKPPPTDEDEERLFALLEQVGDARAALSPTQESTTFTPPDTLPTGVAFLGDAHCGGDILYAQLKRDMETIRDTDGLYAVAMGDYTDNFVANSKQANGLYGGIFNQPGLQDRYAIKRFGIARGKWVAVLDGNHDNWTAKHSGLSKTEDFAAALGAPFFSQGGGTVFVELGDQRYVIAARHNAAGNSRLNTSNAQRRVYDEWPQWENCDVICLAHYHFNDLHIPPRKGGSCVYLRSGTFKVRDSHSQEHGYTPEYGVPLVVLYPGARKVVAFRGDRFEEGVRFLTSERARYHQR